MLQVNASIISMVDEWLMAMACWTSKKINVTQRAIRRPLTLTLSWFGDPKNNCPCNTEGQLQGYGMAGLGDAQGSHG